MHPGFRRVHRTHKSEPKADRCFYLLRERNHPRDKSESRHVVRPDEERHAGCYLGGGTHADHRGRAKRGGGHRTRDTGRRLARQLPAAGAAGAAGEAGTVGTTGDAGAAGTVGDAGAGNGPACNGASDVTVATDGAVAVGSDVGVIPAGDR